MKNLWKLLSLVLVLGLGFASCSDDDDDESPNYLKIGDKTYSLNAGMLEDYGEVDEEGIFNMYLILHSSGLRYNSSIEDYEGKGELVAFDLLSGVEGDIEAGEYSFGMWEYPERFTYVSSEYYLGMDVEVADAFYDDLYEGTVEEDERPWIEGEMLGTLNVEKEGDTYIIDFSGMSDNFKVVEIHFQGKLGVLEFSDEDFYGSIKERSSGFSVR